MSLAIRQVGDGVPVVFLHGFMGDGGDFEDVVSALGDGFRCVLVDLPGHGASPLGGGVWGVERMGRAVEDGLEGVGEAHLVGYSMGGRIALWSATRGRRRWRSVTLVSASPGISEEKARRERVELDRRRGAAIREGGLEAFLRGWYEMEIFAGLRERPGFEATLARRAGGDPEVVAGLIESMSPGLQEDLWPALGEIGVPTLWVAGEEDEKYVEISRRAAARCPDGVWEVIPGAGHSVHLERPGLLGRQLRGFLRG